MLPWCDWMRQVAAGARYGTAGRCLGCTRTATNRSFAALRPREVRYSSSIARKARKRWQGDAGRDFLKGFAAQRGATLLDASFWTAVTTKSLVAAGGSGLLSKYGSSIPRMLLGELQLDVTKERRQRCTAEYWAEKANRRAFLDGLRTDMGIRTMSQWADVTEQDVRARGGGGILRHSGNSLYLALAATYDNLPEAFIVRKHVPKGHWQTLEHRVAFVRYLATAKGLDTLTDWVRVTREDFAAHGGSGLLRKEYGGIATLLREAYPSASATDLARARASLPLSFLDEATNVRLWVRDMEPLLGVREPMDWYRVSLEQVAATRGSGILRRMTLPQALALAYPDVAWDWSGTRARSAKAGQGLLARLVSMLVGHDRKLAV